VRPSSPRILSGAKLPPRLKDLRHPPKRLYLHGELPGGPCVALVGTRRPSRDALAYARHLAGALAQAGCVIASGGAAGIDTAAHEGALDVGGVTLVVAPSGFMKPFPEANRALFARVVESGGAYLSLVRPHVVATRPRFFARNRVLVALCHVVVMVQAPWRSGARNAMKHARELGRTAFVVTHPPWCSRGSGAVLELGLGARPLSGPRDVLRVLAAQRVHPIDLGPGRPPAPLPHEPAPAAIDAESDTGHPPEIAAGTRQGELFPE
jgi:DNA processing protein